MNKFVQKKFAKLAFIFPVYIFGMLFWPLIPFVILAEELEEMDKCASSQPLFYPLEFAHFICSEVLLIMHYNYFIELMKSSR